MTDKENIWNDSAGKVIDASTADSKCCFMGECSFTCSLPLPGFFSASPPIYEIVLDARASLSLLADMADD